MSDTVRKWVILGGLVGFVLLGGLSGWNGYAASRWAAVNEAPPTAGQVAGVALPGALGTAGGVASFVAWLAGVWKPQPHSAGSATIDLLKAAAVLIDSNVGAQAKAMLASISTNGFPPSGRIELTWPDKPSTVIQWGPPKAAAEFPAAVKGGAL